MTKAFSSTLVFALVLWSGFALTGCGPTDADKISDAQTCLNSATPDEADTCVAMVAGIDSASASLIRCSGAFIKQGFGDGTKISDALQQLNGGSGASQSIAMIAELAFGYEANTADNLTDAQNALSECNASGSPGLIFLAGIASTATQTAQVVGADPSTLTSTDVTNALTTIASGSDPAAAATVGNAALTIYNTSCGDGNTTAGNYCQQFESVIQSVGTDPNSVGQFLATCYTTPSTSGCQGF
jgi:hypothetical protein